VATLLAAACGDTTGDGDGPRIVATTSIIGDLVAEVAGDAATVEVLMPIGADPHEFALSSRDAAALQEADLVVTSGRGLEAGVADAADAAAEAGVPVLELGDELDGSADETGCGSGSNDPHWFTDPVLVAESMPALAEAVATAVGPDPTIGKRADAYEEELLALDIEIRNDLADIPADRRALITNHDVLGCFAARYDLTVAATIIPGGTTLAETSAASLQPLVDLLRGAEAKVLFVESSAPSAVAEALAGEVGESVAVVELYTESLGPPDSDAATYVDMLRTDSARIGQALT
jgi:zinc/manganese transport system substrate-binding protein